MARRTSCISGESLLIRGGRRFADETGYEVHDRLRALLTYFPHNENRPRLPAWRSFNGIRNGGG